MHRVVALLGLLLAFPLAAQPDLTRRIGSTVADTGVTGWHFEQFRMGSRDGLRRYRVRLALPDAPAPAAGFPAVYLLDGNAALMEIDATLLATLGKAMQPPVLVFVGYDNDLRIDADARAYDYTPQRPGGEEAQRDVLGGRRNGGADAFLDLLETVIVPKAESMVRLDPRRRTLWGHSYGGVFALHALFARPRTFAGYAAADPSLWWGDGQLLKEEAAVASWPNPPPRLWLWLGEGGERAPASAPPSSTRDPAAVEAMRRARGSVPPDAARRMAERLRRSGLDVRLETLSGQSHGQTLGSSLHRLLRALAEPPAPQASAQERR